MRKEYQKPALYAEAFEMVEHIAGDVCGYSITKQTNHWNLNTCTWDLNGVPIFLTGNSNCLEEYDTSEVPISCYDYGITTGSSTATVYS